MSSDVRLPENEREALRLRYARLADYDIARIHSAGKEGLGSPEAWELLEAEYSGRALAGSDAELLVAADAEIERREEAIAATSAHFEVRLLQGILDLCVSGVAALVAAYVVRLVAPQSALDDLWAGGLAVTVILIVLLGYHPFFEIRRQATPVMAWMGLRVVTNIGERPHPLQLIARSLLRPFCFFNIFWWVFWWMIARNPWGHDVLSGTRVILRPAQSDSAPGTQSIRRYS